MDLRRLTLFVAVVDHNGFTAAADATHVAQPSVSLAVRELEHELGAELLVRSRHGVVLTTAGEALIGPARRALRDVAIATAAVAAVTGLIAGHLDVASLPSLAADPLAPLVGAFRRAYPGVTVQLGAPPNPHELAEAVRSGHTEVAFTEAGPANDGLEETFHSVQELFAVSPPGTSGNRTLALRSLGGIALVLAAPDTSMRALVEGALAAINVTPRIAVESDQRDALIALVLAGAGTTFLPAGAAETARALGAVVQSTRPALRRDLVIVHRKGQVSPAARAFTELASRGSSRVSVGTR
jgi:LysR family transcriptional regulator, carnitine catabolism transcriptional activator